MLRVPGILILENILLALLQDLRYERRDEGLVGELAHGREERLEVEDDGAGEGQAAQRLPVDAEVTPVEGQGWGLAVAVRFVGVAGRHVERRVDFEAPAAALDGLGGRHFGEVSGVGGLVLRWRDETWGFDKPVHGELHLLFVVWDRGVDLVELQADLRAEVPAEGGADDAGAEVVVACLWVAEHDREVLWDVVQEGDEWVLRGQVLGIAEDLVGQSLLVL